MQSPWTGTIGGTQRNDRVPTDRNVSTSRQPSPVKGSARETASSTTAGEEGVVIQRKCLCTKHAIGRALTIVAGCLQVYATRRAISSHDGTSE